MNLFFDPEVLYTAADSRFATFQDVLDHARKGGGKWGAANPASLERQTLEQLKQKASDSVLITFEGGGDMLVNVLNHTLDMGIGELQEIRGSSTPARFGCWRWSATTACLSFPISRPSRNRAIDLAVRKFRGLAGPKGTPPDVIAAWEAAIPKLLEDPEYKQLYLSNSLQPGFIAHAEYVRFMSEFGRETEAFLRESGVIK